MENIKVNKKHQWKECPAAYAWEHFMDLEGLWCGLKVSLNEFWQLWYEIQVSPAENAFALICLSGTKRFYTNVEIMSAKFERQGTQSLGQQDKLPLWGHICFLHENFVALMSYGWRQGLEAELDFLYKKFCLCDYSLWSGSASKQFQHRTQVIPSRVLNNVFINWCCVSFSMVWHRVLPIWNITKFEKVNLSFTWICLSQRESKRQDHWQEFSRRSWHRVLLGSCESLSSSNL